MTTTNEHTELEELLQAIRNQLGDDFDPSDCFYEQGLLYRAAAMLEAQRPALKPLTDEQINDISAAAYCGHDIEVETFPQAFARAIIAEFCRINGITGEAQPAEQANGQEAFGTFVERNDGTTEFRRAGEAHSPTAQGYKFWTLYTTPPDQPAREWVSISDDEIYDMYSEPRSDAEMVEFARAIESKLREKNAGLPAAVPDGYALVPVEPTREMVNAAMRECSGIGGGSCGEHTGVDGDDMRAVFCAMLAVAPKPQDDLPAILKKQAS